MSEGRWASGFRPDLPPGCMTSAKLFNLSEPPFLNLPNDSVATRDKGLRELLPESSYVTVVEMLWQV